MSQKQLGKIVLNHFNERKEYYLKKKQITVDHPFIKHIKEINKNQIQILDIGTGGGTFIYGIKSEIPTASCFATDITMETLKQIRKDGIEFIGSSVYSLPFSSNSFDVIVFSNLLHHLVGKDRKESLELVNLAFEEILRIAKKNSIICIHEECVPFKYQSVILFWLTYSFAKLNLEWKFFHIYNKVVISFLTFNELKRVLLSHNIETVFLNTSNIYNSGNLRLRMLRFIANPRFITAIGNLKK